ncbi:MAG: hypothetical protein ACYS7Y_20170 [Planctomycetota bacterium]|jgi:hypothetical protein
MSYVEKYVASFNHSGELKVVMAKFRKTPKLYILAEDDTCHPIRGALSYGTRFAHDDWRLADSPEAALATLKGREQRNIEHLTSKISEAETRMGWIAMKQAEREQELANMREQGKEFQRRYAGG